MNTMSIRFFQVINYNLDNNHCIVIYKTFIKIEKRINKNYHSQNCSENYTCVRKDINLYIFCKIRVISIRISCLQIFFLIYFFLNKGCFESISFFIIKKFCSSLLKY